MALTSNHLDRVSEKNRQGIVKLLILVGFCIFDVINIVSFIAIDTNEFLPQQENTKKKKTGNQIGWVKHHGIRSLNEGLPNNR